MRATNPPLASSGMTDCSFRCGQSSLLEHEAQRLEADRRGQLHLDEPFGEQLEAPVLGASGPGRPGWLPTQVSGKEVTSPPPPPGSRGALLLPSPLRTTRKPFGLCRSSLSQGSLRNPVGHKCTTCTILVWS